MLLWKLCDLFIVFGYVGQIGYALVPMIARGVMLGANQPVILHMLDIPPAAEALNGVKMELVDAAFPLLKGWYFWFYDMELNLSVNMSRICINLLI